MACLDFPALTLVQINMMKHAWGWAEREPGYRTHYCTDLNNAEMEALVRCGMFTCTYTKGFGEGMGMFHLTDAGIAFLKELKK